MKRDELAMNLEHSFGAMIKEANEWRPLAQYVLDLMTQFATDMLMSSDKETN